MIGRGAMSNSIEELAGTKFLLVAGSNTTETHPVIALRMKRAVRNGAGLVVVDPRKIELTRFARRHLQLKVGTDIAVFNAMAHVIIRERLYNEEFVRNRTEGFEALARHVGAYSPEYAAAVSGLRAEDIVATAREYAAASPKAAICYTVGITEHSCGTHNVQAIANLAMLCGNFGMPNSGVNPLRGQNNVQGTGDMGSIPTDLPGYQKLEKPEVRAKFEKAWGVTLPRRRGITKITAIDQMLRGKMKAVYIMGENTVVSDPNASHVEHALRKVDFLVVQDIFLTETARLADVVLPAAAFAETEGTFTNSERRVQRVRKAVEPPGEARPDWQIILELFRRMGRPQNFQSPSQIWDEAASVAPILSGISYDRLENEGGLQWPCPTKDHPGTVYLHTDEFPSGQPGFFAPVDHIPPAEEPDPEYPLVLTTGRRRVTYHTGTQTGRSSGFELLVPHEWAEISPHDAEALGIEDGEVVMVASRRGRVEVPAKVTDRSPRGVVFMSFAFPELTRTNNLTNDAYDFITETPEFKACAVRIEKLAAARPAAD
jgi:formate dehydrogenase major subunit/formate dehydrogenase alpha subunit